jgi:imidazolonepropionase-like amidohydrolase
MATSGAAEILGIGKRTGRIKPGYEADIVFLTADPSVDVANAEKVFGVLNNGQLQVADKLTGGAQ